MSAVRGARASGTCLACATLALAAGAADAAGGTWTLGLGVPYDGSTYLEHESDLPAFPVLSYEYGRFNVSPLGLEVEFHDSARGLDGQERRPPDWSWRLSGKLNVGFGSRDEDESPAFEGMEDRDDETTLGLGVRATTPFGTLAAGFDADVVDASGGYRAEASYSRPLYVDRKVLLVASAGVAFRSEEQVDYYYGVRASEAEPGRPAYGAGAAVDPFAGYLLRYGITPRWSAVQTLRVLRLDDDVVKSPLTTDDEVEWQGAVLVTYTFGGAER